MQFIKGNKYILFCAGPMRTLRIEVFIEYENDKNFFSDFYMGKANYQTDHWQILEYNIENLLNLVTLT